MAAPPIYNPVIPCVHPLPGGMYPGRMIRVQGNIPPGAQRFAINLQCGPNTDPRDDIALHLNFRFVEMCVVRNHLTAMSWGVEETAGGMPLQRGEPFEALILCEPQSIKVALNGAHFCEFMHRVPYQRMTHITVDGDVHVQLIGFEGAQPPPQQQYMAEPPAYGAYGAPPPAYGAPAYGAPRDFGQPVGAYDAAYAPQQQRRGLGTGAAVGLGVGALAAGGLAGYALGGGFSSDSPREEGYSAGYPGYPSGPSEPFPEVTRPDSDYLEAPSAPDAEIVGESPAETTNDGESKDENANDDDYLENNDGNNDNNDGSEGGNNDDDYLENNDGNYEEVKEADDKADDEPPPEAEDDDYLEPEGPPEEVNVIETADFGGDDWMD